MSSIFSELGGITGGVAAEGLAFAAGFAAGRALEPAAVTISQDAWNAAQVRRIDAGLAAAIASEEIADYTVLQDEASYSGIDASRFAYLYNVNLTAPGVGELLNMVRRSTINSGNFSHGLRKNKLEPMWDVPLADLANVYIGLGDIATAIVRGAVPAPAWVPVAPPVTTDHVPRFPVTDIDPIALAAKLGYSEDMLKIMTARSGLSLAPILATQANFRGALTDNDWLLAIAEGDLRTEWAETLKAAARAIPSPGEWMELALRGWITLAEAEAGAALHGMTQPNADLLYQLKRRPLSPHQIKQALARGATFDTTNAPYADPYLASVHEANLGPEWYDMAISLQGAYASIFVTNRLVTGGTITPDTGMTWLQKGGYADEVVTALHDSWTASGSTAADKDVASAATKLKTRTHSSYVAAEIDDTAATTALGAAGVAAAAVPQILTLWQAERALIRKQLTPTQIRKAVSGAVVNPATGAAWTQAEAVAALLARGYDQADAETFLAE